MITTADLLAEARALADGHEASETRLRSAISRAYLAALHQILIIAWDHQHRFSRDQKRDAFLQLITFLQSVSDRNLKNTGGQLAKLHQLYRKADYYLAYNVTTPDVRYALALADRILKQHA